MLSLMFVYKPNVFLVPFNLSSILLSSIFVLWPLLRQRCSPLVFNKEALFDRWKVCLELIELWWILNEIVGTFVDSGYLEKWEVRVLFKWWLIGNCCFISRYSSKHKRFVRWTTQKGHVCPTPSVCSHFCHESSLTYSSKFSHFRVTS